MLLFVSCLSWECKDNLGTEKLIEAITETFITETDDIQSELCGYVFKVEYTERKKRLSYLRLYHGTLHLRDTLLLSKRKNKDYRNVYSVKW